MDYRIPTILLALAVFMPAFTHAAVSTSVSATSDTGGNHVTSGGYVTTGASSASVDVQTVSGGSGSSTVHIETTINGEKHVETYTKQGSVGVSVTASSSGYRARVWVPGSTTPATTTSSVRHTQTATTSLVATTATVPAASPNLLSLISHWFGRFFSIFGRY